MVIGSANASHCARVYRPPRNPVRSTDGKKNHKPSCRRVWLIGTEDREFPETERSIYEDVEQAAKSRLRNRRTFEVELIRWTGHNAFPDRIRLEDIIVQLSNGTQIEPYGRLLAKRSKTVTGRRVTYLSVESLKKFSVISWSKFKNQCASMGLRLGKGVSAREIRNAVHQSRVLSLTSPDKLRRPVRPKRW